MISLETLALKVQSAATAVSGLGKIPITHDEEQILLSRLMEMDYVFEPEMQDIENLSRAHLL